MPHERLGVLRAAMQGAVLVVMSACSSVMPVLKHPGSVLRHHSDDSTGATQASEVTKAQSDAISSAFKAADEQCKASFATPELDPIRHKVELFREPGETPLPFEIATNDSFPTRDERPVIAKWASLRDECIRRRDELPYIPPSATTVQITMLKQLRSFGQQVTAGVTELTIGLYQQKLTYGEFGRKRYEIGRAQAAFILAIQQAAAGSNDLQRQMQDLQSAQQQFTDTLDAFSKYVRAVNARQPRSVHMDGKKQVAR